MMGSYGKRKEDRLSFLPDHILIDILSLLPVQFAIVTSVLSHRWRYLWTQITSFNFKPSKSEFRLLCYYDEFDETFMKLTSPSIARLQLSFNYIPRYASLVIDSWVGDVCARNVEIIKLSVGIPTWSLPLCVFSTKSLVELDIQNVMYFNLPNITNLPNLKKLSIKGDRYTASITLFEKFINSCPSLEDLYFDLNVSSIDLISHVNLIVPNLRRLGMHLNYRHFNIVIGIDAPNLKHFTFSGQMVFHFVESPALLEAKLQHYGEDNILVSKFVESISHSVRYLEVKFVPLKPLERLSYLSCKFNAKEFKKLMKLLETSPGLKVIKLEIDLYSFCTDDWRWEEWRLQDLEGLQTNLDKIELRMDWKPWVVKYMKNVLNLVKFLLSTSKDLKHLAFIIEYGYNSWEKEFPTFEKNFVEFVLKVKKVSNYEINLSSVDGCWSVVAFF